MILFHTKIASMPLIVILMQKNVIKNNIDFFFIGFLHVAKTESHYFLLLSLDDPNNMV